MAVMEFANVSFRYPTSKEQVLKEVSFQVQKGEFIVLCGASGSGKTTLLSIIAGLDKQESGKIYYEGDDLDKIGLYKYRRNKIGIVFQQYNLISYLTGLENMNQASSR